MAIACSSDDQSPALGLGLVDLRSSPRGAVQSKSGYREEISVVGQFD